MLFKSFLKIYSNRNIFLKVKTDNETFAKKFSKLHFKQLFVVVLSTIMG